MTGNGGRAGRGWAIGGAFAGQVGIFAGIGALLVGTASAPVAVPVYAGTASAPAAVPLYAGPASAIVAPVPAAAPGIPRPSSFRYTFLVDGSASGDAFSGVYPQRQAALPAYTVTPGQRADIKLSVTIPAGLKLDYLTLSSIEGVPHRGQPLTQQLYLDTTGQPLAPGRHTFGVAWPGPGNSAQPGSEWLIYLSAGGTGAYLNSPIATITVAS
jgi:hypothetical protein